MKEGIDLSQQIPFGSDAPRKQDHPSRVMEMLGHEMIGGYFETFLPSSFVERVASGEIEFGSLSEELLVLSEELLDVEKELVEGESGLPKAADAEMYMDPEYAMRTAEGNLVGVTESKVVSKFRDGESDDVVFVQKSFQSVEAIDAKISQVGKFMNQALAEIVKLREDPFFRHLNLPVDQTGELIDLGPLNRNKIQKLAVWDLHWRNLRELARVYAMYRDMTMGSLNPTKIENGQSWVMEDDSEKFSLRSQAEMISGEIYGELDESVWQGDMYLYLGSFWGKNEAMDKLVNELMDKYLPDFPRETRDELERKRLIL